MARKSTTSTPKSRSTPNSKKGKETESTGATRAVLKAKASAPAGTKSRTRKSRAPGAAAKAKSATPSPPKSSSKRRTATKSKSPRKTKTSRKSNARIKPTIPTSANRQMSRAKDSAVERGRLNAPDGMGNRASPTDGQITQSPPNQASAAADPRQQEALEHLKQAASLHQNGQLDDAISHYGRVLANFPNSANVLNDLGVALRSQGKLYGAIACYRRAIALGRQGAGTWSNMGNAYRDLRRYQEAVRCHQKAVDFDPSNATSIYNLGLSLRDIGELQRALECLEKALDLQPENPEYHWDQAISYLQLGDYKRGFGLYDWRKKLARAVSRTFSQPEWQGEPLNRRTLYIHGEQGFGDMLQFARFIPLVAKKGDKLIVECNPSLLRLFATLDGEYQLVTTDHVDPDFDLYVSLPSLPRIFGTELETLPAAVPYLHPPEISNIRIVRPADKRLKVGIVWAGKLTPRDRSCPLHHFLELMETPGAAFYSLQLDQRANDLAAYGCGGLVVNVAPHIRDFADTASVMAQLDLVITIDTAAAHLAGALGVPVWTLLNYVSDWRWLLARGDSPWYPSMRLFRQTTPEDWDEVFVGVRHAFNRLLQDHQAAQAK